MPFPVIPAWFPPAVGWVAAQVGPARVAEWLASLVVRESAPVGAELLARPLAPGEG